MRDGYRQMAATLTDPRRGTSRGGDSRGDQGQRKEEAGRSEKTGLGVR